jgi:hypothetical protein
MNMRQVKLMKKRTYPRFGNGFVTQAAELAGNKNRRKVRLFLFPSGHSFRVLKQQNSFFSGE